MLGGSELNNWWQAPCDYRPQTVEYKVIIDGKISNNNYYFETLWMNVNVANRLWSHADGSSINNNEGDTGFTYDIGDYVSCEFMEHFN